MNSWPYGLEILRILFSDELQKVWVELYHLLGICYSLSFANQNNLFVFKFEQLFISGEMVLLGPRCRVITFKWNKWKKAYHCLVCVVWSQNAWRGYFVNRTSSTFWMRNGKDVGVFSRFTLKVHSVRALSLLLNIGSNCRRVTIFGPIERSFVLKIKKQQQKTNEREINNLHHTHWFLLPVWVIVSFLRIWLPRFFKQAILEKVWIIFVCPRRVCSSIFIICRVLDTKCEILSNYCFCIFLLSDAWVAHIL